jgi:hypothetical protein
MCLHATRPPTIAKDEQYAHDGTAIRVVGSVLLWKSRTDAGHRAGWGGAALWSRGRQYERISVHADVGP